LVGRPAEIEKFDVEVVLAKIPRSLATAAATVQAAFAFQASLI
jgi:hypothetical protein